ncbi:hypothetical protein ACWD0A_32205 [Streptomyces sp. NPDC002867]
MSTKKTTVAVVLAIAVAVSACGAEPEQPVGKGAPKPTDTRSVEPPADDDGDSARTIGDTVTLRDDTGRPMQVTLTGVAYRDAFAKDKTLSLPGKYALAASFTMTSKTGGRLGDVTGNFIRWEKNGDSAETAGYSDAPWQGCIDGYTPYAETEPNQEYKAITDFNVSSQGGLIIIEDQYGGVALWEIPAKDAGTGTEPATRYTTVDC